MLLSDMNGDSALHWAAYKGFPGLMQVYFRRFGGFSIATFFVLLELKNWRICRLFLACFDFFSDIKGFNIRQKCVNCSLDADLLWVRSPEAGQLWLIAPSPGLHLGQSGRGEAPLR